MSKRVLVTGGNGQLGRSMRDVAPNYIYTDVEELDITDVEAIRGLCVAEKIEVVVNCAAYTAVDKAEDDERVADLINNKSVENLAVVCRELGATLIHVSTDYVFSGDKNTPCREDEPTSPLGVYGKTKLAGEQSIARVGCRALIFRTAWLYSAYGANFVKTIKRLSAERESLKVVFDQVGTPTNAADLAAIIYKVIEEDMLTEGIYHYSNEGVCSWYDFARQIVELSGNECDVQPCYSDEFPSKVKRPHFSVLDKSKVKSTFGAEVPYWVDSLRLCMTKLQ
ncbi:MAG: dTDP-4-dehydrorhamnose reductase [Rikenellaceae bacterium]